MLDEPSRLRALEALRSHVPFDRDVRLGAWLILSVALLGACSGGSGGGPVDGSGGAGTGGSASGGRSGTGDGGTGTGGAASGGVPAATGGHGSGGSLGSGGRIAGTGGGTASGGVTGSGGTGTGGEAGKGTGGGSGGATSSATGLVNTYDGARSTTVSFDSAWKFHQGDASGAQAATFDDSSWTALDVPHDWSISLPFTQNSPAGGGGGYLNGGVGWYRKTFTLPASASGQKIFVQFDGIYMDSTVYLNGTQVGARPYGFSSFECDLTASAKPGASNVLAVRVNNQQPSSRWYSGSGIYRHTWLKTVNPVRVAYTGAVVTTPQVSSTSAAVNISVTVQNDTTSAQSVTVASSVGDASGAAVGAATSPATAVAAGKTATVMLTMTVANPKLWSLASPTMYSAITTVSVGNTPVDTYTTSFGIRTFAFSAANGFTLNGAAVKLNGTCNHHDLGALGAAVNTRAI